MSSLKKIFTEELVPKLQEELKIKNRMAVPRFSKIVVNTGVKDALSDKKNIDKASDLLAQITGQKPKITAAKKAIAGFKLREGDKIGLVVTLRGDKMYNFLDKIITVVLPRLRDFRGMNPKSFDGQGNYTIGFTEPIVFPEIDAGKIDTSLMRQGMEVTIVTTAKNDKDGYALLRVTGMPFRHEKTRMQGGIKTE